MATIARDLLNPKETIRSVLLDPSSDIYEGMAHPKLWGSQQSIDVGPVNGRGGLLAGKIRLRDPRNIKSAAAGQSIYESVSAKRVNSERFDPTEKEFSIKRVSGQTEMPIKDIENSFDPDEEMHNMEIAMASVALKKERWCADFFLAKSGDTFAQADFAVPGWTAVNWTGSYTALGTATDFLGNLHKVIAPKRKDADGRKFNAFVCDQACLEYLQRDSSVLGRFIKDNGTSGVAIVNGQQVAPEGFVSDVFMQHFGLEIVVFGAIHANQRKGTAESNAYIGRTGRAWIGLTGPLGVSGLGSTSPTVYRLNSAYGVVTQPMEMGAGDLQDSVLPTHRQFAVDDYLDPVLLDASFGFQLFNLHA